MTKKHEIVLSLLRLAISGRKCTLPKTVDWMKVIDFAIQQGVLGVCFESIELLSKQVPSSKIQVPGGFPNMDSLMEWFGQVEYQKAEYKQRLDVATRFAAELEKAGVRICVLKGLAYARYFQQPEIRYSCDFDCVLSDFEIGNLVAEPIGAEVDRTEQKHSHIQLDGIHIENHHTCTGADCKGMEEYLSKFLFCPIMNGSHERHWSCRH